MDNNYIFVQPIFDLAQVGCGIHVGKYFITAGHIYNSHSNLYVYINNSRVLLNQDNLVYSCFTEDVPSIDLAIFRLDCENNAIMIADYTPSPNQQLFCIAFNTIIETQDSQFPSGIGSSKERIEQIKTSVIAREERQGQLFACNSVEVFLRPGNSGSPLFDDKNRLVGILSGGRENTEICFFQNVESIHQILKKNR